MSSESTPRASRTLLHACCGPCSLEPTRIFAEDGIDFDILYSNSNIFPVDEYEHRLSTLREHVTQPQNIRLHEARYEPDAWEQEVAIHGLDRENRCRACYRMRFEDTAREAVRLGYDTISTTLSISPYQLTDIIIEELEAAADRHGLKAEARDFSDCYQEATRISREKGMYRQDYCGCRFSIAEAAEQREQARQQRAEAKRLRRIARLCMAAEGVYSQQSEV